MPRDPTRRFSDRVENYEKYRPTYPPAVITFVQSCLSDVSPSTVQVADIGAGTGKFTRQLLEAGYHVWAVEPNAAMRMQAERNFSHHPVFHSIAGRAEATGLLDSSCDLITVAQAIHWFDFPQTLAEFRRILKPTGLLMVLWNERDDSDPFQKAYQTVLQQYCPEYNESPQHDVNRAYIHQYLSQERLREFHCQNTQTFDYPSLRGRVLSSSYCPSPDSPLFSPLEARLQELYREFADPHGITFQYHTHVYCSRILKDSS